VVNSDCDRVVTLSTATTRLPVVPVQILHSVVRDEPTRTVVSFVVLYAAALRTVIDDGEPATREHGRPTSAIVGHAGHGVVPVQSERDAALFVNGRPAMAVAAVVTAAAAARGGEISVQGGHGVTDHGPGALLVNGARGHVQEDHRHESDDHQTPRDRRPDCVGCSPPFDRHVQTVPSSAIVLL